MQEIETIALPYPLEEFSSIVDVRTPLEFAEDHLPGAINLPVLSNEQRVEVGTLYKQDPFAARILGARYLSINVADHLITLEKTWDRKEQPLLYCWRGGLRSRSFAHILRSVGWRARLVDGGYKSYRKFVLNDLKAQLAEPLPPFHVICGLTGTGKTRLLHHLREAGAQVLDLEELANHRGSLLGNVGPQPAQKLFENRIHQAISRFQPGKPVFVEAESNRIGALSLPAPLWKKLSTATVTEVQLPLPSRAQLLLEDYPRFLDEPADLCALLDRLRSLRGHQQVDAWHEQIHAGDWANFLQSILRDHYDLCYRPAGSEKSNYQKPSAQFHLPSHHQADFEKAVKQLLNP
ncbi:tRNA 2-selenouridine(34) synthase MnmH [Roseibacillus persicicus]|uniref:tRNA 2-selenouridine synthase n=1 Tax=Roseibacillus persicicus TaxID=454148 RepID=A0A918TIY6_9BACT|nr:tRNA 2-selenouridine(34) synthase MnmH [Roseibacillus persicicus]GHC47055.1 tRNA 2-selenouridine synthase [Roseibacillus persicicus]